jgi:hypothetical protein
MIGALGDDDHVRVHAVECAEKTVDIAPYAAAVSGNARSVKQYEGRTTVGHDRCFLSDVLSTFLPPAYARGPLALCPQHGSGNPPGD